MAFPTRYLSFQGTPAAAARPTQAAYAYDTDRCTEPDVPAPQVTRNGVTFQALSTQVFEPGAENNPGFQAGDDPLTAGYLTHYSSGDATDVNRFRLVLPDGPGRYAYAWLSARRAYTNLQVALTSEDGGTVYGTHALYHGDGDEDSVDRSTATGSETVPHSADVTAGLSMRTADLPGAVVVRNGGDGYGRSRLMALVFQRIDAPAAATPTVTGVAITAPNPLPAHVPANGTVQFGATVTAAAGTDTSVTWWASGAGTIGTNGQFVAASTGGPATVRATSVQDPTFKADYTFTVDAPGPTGTDGYTASDRTNDMTTLARTAQILAALEAVQMTLAGLTTALVRTEQAAADGRYLVQQIIAESHTLTEVSEAVAPATAAEVERDGGVLQVLADTGVSVDTGLQTPVGELTQAPPVDRATPLEMLRFVYHKLRNPAASSRTADTLYRADGQTPLHSVERADDGVTARRGA